MIWRKKKSQKEEKVMLKGSHFIKIYEEDYAWLPRYFEELGFSRKKDYYYKDLHLTDTFIHEISQLTITLTLEFSPRRRSWDVIGIWLMSTENTSVDKRWSVWLSEMDKEQFKNDIRLAVNAFATIDAFFADYDDNEPLYLFSNTKPILRGEDYFVSNDEKWLHATSLGQLFIDAFALGCTKINDVRPVKKDVGLWDGFDKDGNRTGGIVWEDGYGGIVTYETEALLDQKRRENGLLKIAFKELEERMEENEPEIFPQNDVSLCLGNIIEPYQHHLSCPFCGKSSEELHWIHFCSPPQTWRDMCGREGALSICTNCGWQIEFICEIMN